MKLSMLQKVQDEKFIARRLGEGYPMNWIDDHGRVHPPTTQCFACANRNLCKTRQIEVAREPDSAPCSNRIENALTAKPDCYDTNCDWRLECAHKSKYGSNPDSCPFKPNSNSKEARAWQPIV